MGRPLIRLRGFHPLRPAFPKQFCFKFRSRSRVLHPAHIAICGLGSSDFARHYFRNRYFFLFLRVLRCFSSPGSPRKTMDSFYDTAALPAVSSLIRTSADLCLCATPRSFSQLVTSFFGAMYQGIHLYALCSLIFLSCTYFYVLRRIILPSKTLKFSRLIALYFLVLTFSSGLKTYF